MKKKEIIYDPNIKTVKVLSKMVFATLMANGFSDYFIGTEPNKVNNKLSVFKFKNNKKLVDLINYTINNKQ